MRLWPEVMQPICRPQTRTHGLISVWKDWRKPISTGNKPRRGEIWLADMDKLRPAVVMHRDFAGQALGAVLVAPLTSTLRDVPTAVRLGTADGLDRECVASLDNLTLLRRERFRRLVGRLSPDRMRQLCRAMAIALDCEETQNQ